MYVMKVRNVCEALPKGLSLLQKEGIVRKSRAGNVIVTPFPVTTVYTHPQERVLFDKTRNANPLDRQQTVMSNRPN